MTKEKELASHPLLNILLENSKPITDIAFTNIKDHFNRTKKLRIEKGPILSEKQQYDVNVLFQAMSLLNCIDRLKNITKFVKRFPSPITYKRQGISHYTWLEYHYSYYVIILVSLSDLSLILINYIFRLGNPEKSCRPDIIKKNKWVKRSTVNEKLDLLDKIIAQHRPIRNYYIHRGQTPQLYKIFDSDMLDYLDLVSFTNLHSKQIDNDELLDVVYKGETDKICDILKTEISQLSEVIWQIFDSLLPVYENHANLLQE